MKELLRKLGWTQVKLSKEFPANPQTVSAWCKGLYRPNIFQLKRISDLLGVSMEDLTVVLKNQETLDKGGMKE
jgi:DNA-binding XRE family transcriptional regulator